MVSEGISTSSVVQQPPTPAYSSNYLPWIPNIGATHHITLDPSSLHHSKPYQGNDRLQVASGQQLPISHTGTLIVPSSSHLLHLNDILHVPNSQKSLLSVQNFCQDNQTYFEFHPSHFLIKDQVTHRPLLSGTSDEGLYRLHPSLGVKSPGAFSAQSSSESMHVWHHRLGHPHDRVFKQVIRPFKL
ncbi:hypothetical protein LIER_41432 [Lithospermum erythrorhizon]|uniref:GAG-pre-integrase domain-containing protein n=1 Tax=Lithospermum erythrorhizon TaxID=34254 RepID=A0AAV3RDA5_LITER